MEPSSDASKDTEGPLSAENSRKRYPSRSLDAQYSYFDLEVLPESCYDLEVPPESYNDLGVPPRSYKDVEASPESYNDLEVPSHNTISSYGLLRDITPTPSEPEERGAKKSRTNVPWTKGEELRLRSMRYNGDSWSDIAKTFPSRTEESVKKHWYKDMHYADFTKDESAALLSAINEYDKDKWKVIGQKVGKSAKACEQYVKEHFSESGKVHQRPHGTYTAYEKPETEDEQFVRRINADSLDISRELESKAISQEINITDIKPITKKTGLANSKAGSEADFAFPLTLPSKASKGYTYHDIYALIDELPQAKGWVSLLSLRFQSDIPTLMRTQGIQPNDIFNEVVLIKYGLIDGPVPDWALKMTTLRGIHQI